MKQILILISFISIISCKQDKVVITPQTLNSGFWRATLAVQDQEELPFIFEANDDGTITIYNAEERIEVDEIEINGDSIRIQTPVFEGYFAGRFRESGNQITGSFIKPSLDRVVPFTMNYGVKERFVSSAEKLSENTANVKVDGSWETVFSPDNANDRYIAKGTFKSDGDIVTGTFRTTTGDYRYLEGKLDGDELRLSTFDGAHAFLFVATVTDSAMQGQFYSGDHWKEPFVATKNDNYELPDANTLTYLKEGYDRLAFSFPDSSGDMVSLEDKRFKNKVVLIKLMGTWCPNCLEESKFIKQYLKEFPSDDLEVVSLAFEYAPTKEKAFASIKRMQERLDIPYPILLAQWGDSDKKKAAEKLPMLNHVLSYPTLIFVDKKGTVRRIHTGYNGTATGEKHLEFKKGFEEFVAQLLAE
ncbi:TlpA disulfide reductase family protein [uncultured Dokdonia sp.]|uniref:peroxiredoxin family protein n=1 Tax=uncultured Dokdonia sp. TaxID=575653 RepID=UPI0030ED63E6|tara:strand:+ start:229274 stop:230521 length:1248 start_codon:yes stop_codon:yes gene_type:complete